MEQKAKFQLYNYKCKFTGTNLYKDNIKRIFVNN